MKNSFLTIVFSCAAAAVLLITGYRSLLQEGLVRRVPVQAVHVGAGGDSAASAMDETTDNGAETIGEAAREDFVCSIDTREDTSLTADSDEGPVQGADSDEEPVQKADSDEAFVQDLDSDEKTVRNVDPDNIRRVALTFDDGPHPIWTVKLLDGLAERGVRATFFVIGENIPGNEEIIVRMDQEGHLIGNHTFNHVKISDLSVEAACEQVEQTSALVKAITGKDTEYVRPPFGSWREDLECSFEMFPVLWDVDPLDWTTKNTSDVVRRVLEAVEPDDIILLHDCYESSVDAALQIVDALRELGYEFVTVDELILE
ncbi:MAG: polysaccharide deacetylase family protein [Clostridiales bacterium]|nr:polysaccharide deacetylase family protein [Clostridiales bacterium]